MNAKEKIKMYEESGDKCESFGAHFDAYEYYSEAKAVLLSEYPIEDETLKRLIKKQNAITDKFSKE